MTRRGGGQKFGMSRKTQRKQTSSRDVMGILLGYPGGARKIENQTLRSTFGA